MSSNQLLSIEQKIDALINSINNSPGKIAVARNCNQNIKYNKNLRDIITKMFLKKYPP